MRSYIRRISKVLVAAILFWPLVVLAKVEITDVSVDAPQRAVYKDRIQVTFNVRFSDLDAAAKDGYGISQIDFEFVVPSNIVTVNSGFQSDWLNAIALNQNNINGYKVVAVPYEKTADLCKNNEKIACGDYKASFTFYIKENSASYFIIGLKEVTATLKPIDSKSSSKDETIKYSANITKRVTISEAGTVTNPSDEDIVPVEADTSSSIDELIQKAREENANGSDVEKQTEDTDVNRNVDLKSLAVAEHDFEFYRDKVHYKILVDKTVNSVEVTAEAEDPSSTVKVIGADDLKASDHKIEVEVSQGAAKKTYVIEVSVQSGKQKNESEFISLFGFKIEKRFLVYAGIVLGIILLVVILKITLGAIGKKFQNRKIDRVLKKIDEKK